MPKEKSDRMLGIVGTELSSGILTEEYNSDLQFPECIEVYEEMRRSDPSIAAVIKTLTEPLKAANWFMIPGGEDEESKEIANFLSKNYFDDLNFVHDILPSILTYIFFGFSNFEREWGIKDGKVFLNKFEYRTPRSVQSWLPNYDTGEAGIHQNATKNGYEIVDVDIPAEKIVRFAFNQEGLNFEGISLLRPMYKPWKFKTFLEKISMVAAERTGVGTPAITTTDNDRVPEENEKENEEEILRNIRANKEAFVRMGYGKEFKFITANGGFEFFNFKNGYEREISKCALAQFLDTGSQGTSGGFAQNKADQDMFFDSVESIAKYITSRWFRLIIKDQVGYNWGDVEVLPQLGYSDVRPVNQAEHLKNIHDMVQAGVITYDEELENSVRAKLGLPVKDFSKVQTQIDQKKEDDKKDPPKKKIKLSDGDTFRTLTLAEEPLDIDKFRSFWDSGEAKLAEIVLAFGAKISPDMKQQASVFFGGGNPKKGEKVAQKTKETEKKLSKELLTQYEFGKTQAIREIGESGRIKTPKATREVVSQTSGLLTSTVQNDMDKEMKQLVTSGKTKGLSKAEVLTSLDASLIAVTNRHANGFSNLQTSSMINRGRIEVAETFKGKIWGEQLSAILDKRTTNLCRSLDGRVGIGVGSLPNPPFHRGCRTLKVFILLDQIGKPKANPVPPSILDNINPNPYKTQQPDKVIK